MSYDVGQDCTPENIIALTGGGGGDADWKGFGGTGGNAGAAGVDGGGGSAIASGRAGKGGSPGTQTAGGTGGAGGHVFDITCFCTDHGAVGQDGQSASTPIAVGTYANGNTFPIRDTGGQGGQGSTGLLGLFGEWGGSGGGGLYGGGGGGASQGFSDSADLSGPLAGTGSGGGGGGSSFPADDATPNETICTNCDGTEDATQGSVEVVAKWASTTTVTSSANPAQPG